MYLKVQIINSTYYYFNLCSVSINNLYDYRIPLNNMNSGRSTIPARAVDRASFRYCILLFIMLRMHLYYNIGTTYLYIFLNNSIYTYILMNLLQNLFLYFIMIIIIILMILLRRRSIYYAP